jgi:hypothetical protein
MELINSGLVVSLFAVFAVCSWVGGAYSVYMGFQSLPADSGDLPFFSDDPQRITEEGRKWRRRIYMSVAGFLWSLLLLSAVKGF